MKKLTFCILFCTLLCSAAFAYGPSTHMREADYYISLCETNPMPGPEHNPDLLRRNRFYLWLGSIWPDIARVIMDKDKVDEGLNDPHNRHLNYFLLQDALSTYPADEWKVAFAVGCLLHNTGDLVAQDMICQRMGVEAHLGEMDVFPGIADATGSEVEGLIEGGMEFIFPALWLYTGMFSHFFLDLDGLADLSEVHAYYQTIWNDFFTKEFKGSFTDLLVAIDDFNPNHYAWSQMTGLESFWNDLATGKASFTVDWSEFISVMVSAVLNPDFWNIYYDEGYFELSPTIMLTFEPGQGYFDHFPNWSSNMKKAGVINSLAYYLPGILEEDNGRFVWDLYWTNDDNGQKITSINTGASPSSITLTVVFWDVPGRSSTEDTVTIRVREDSPSSNILAIFSGDVGIDPWTYDVNDPASLSFSFDPSGAIGGDAAGLIVEIANGIDPAALPFFTTDWGVYEQITQLDMTKDVYTTHHATYGIWPHSLFFETAKKPWAILKVAH